MLLSISSVVLFPVISSIAFFAHKRSAATISNGIPFIKFIEAFSKNIEALVNVVLCLKLGIIGVENISIFLLTTALKIASLSVLNSFPVRAETATLGKR